MGGDDKLTSLEMSLDVLLLSDDDEFEAALPTLKSFTHSVRHAALTGISATIVMPLPTPLIKVSATRGFGGDVVLHGSNYDEAYEEALRLGSKG